MRLSKDFFYTIKENIADEDSVSGKLLVRSGMIKKISNGIYAKMPLGKKVLKNIENIVRKNMNIAGANELSMPALLPMDVFEKTGRKSVFGSSMFKLNDRYNREYALGPTHEELFVLASMSRVKSYRDLPFTIYQIGSKYRDEIRPRLGLIRIREFLMKDAYSFDKDYEGLDISYKKMFDAYHKIFTELGIEYTVVKADTGAMGGLLSEEFHAVTDIGEDVLVLCDNCNYSSNLEVSQNVNKSEENLEDEKELELVETSNAHTIEDVSKFLKIDIKRTVKALIMSIDNNLVILFIRGDRELNENKVLKLLGGNEINFADDELISKSNAVPGYTGPINLEGAKIVIDNEVLGMKNFCCGANKMGYHYINANIKDFKYDFIGDIVNVKEGDTCPNCGGKLVFKKGIEIGNTFKLGTKYSESLGLNYLGDDNKNHPVVMGCYGIGLERILSAIVEQNNDEKGIIWPINVAPYKVAIVVINPKDEKQYNEGEKLYSIFNELGIDTLIDDRNERAGVKFNDIDLIGIPIRITVGKKINENLVEIKLRQENDIRESNTENVVDEVKDIINRLSV